MTLTADAIAKIEELARQKEITSNDHHFVPEGYVEVKAKPFPTLEVGTLDALVDYLLDDVDGVGAHEPFVHILSPSTVRVNLPWGTEGRYIALQARYESPLSPAVRGGSITDGFVPLEIGLIQLQTMFEEAGDRPEVLKILGNVRDEAIRTQADDGVTQTVTARAGITVVEDVEVPRVVDLRPFRTFPEVLVQPASPFVLRLRKGKAGIEVALFEADNEAWRLKAIQGIKRHLEEALSEADLTILA